ncbi:MAG: hypothetical protein ACRDJC_16365 [Thermomicrobiales bacterium]
MNGSLFDGWTRRRFGLAAGSTVAATLGVSAIGAVKAKRKKRKKRCRRINQSCRTNSKKKRCCKHLSCNEAKTNSPTGLRCCRLHQAVCESEMECCSSLQCELAVGLDGPRCCAPTGTFCSEVSDCCASMVGSVGCNNVCTLSL